MVASVSNNDQHLLTLYSVSRQKPDAYAASGSTKSGTQTVSFDTISLRSDSTQTITYSEGLSKQAGERSQYGLLQNLVANLLKEQGIDTKIALGDTEIDLGTITQDQAQKLVGDDGYFGVKQTSERIFQFAVGIAGNDPSRIEAIKQGIDQGFAEAKKAFGDWLPDISHDTYDAVMNKLDDWVSEAQGLA